MRSESWLPSLLVCSFHSFLCNSSLQFKFIVKVNERMNGGVGGGAGESVVNGHDPCSDVSERSVFLTQSPK